MNLKTCLKKLFRTPLKTFLFFLLLTVTGALLSLGASLFINAREVNKNVQESFTTIAIPNFDIIKDDSLNHNKEIYDLSREELIDTIESMNKSYYKILGQASETKIGDVDLRKSYLGFSKDLLPVLFGPYVQRRNLTDWSLTHNMAVFEAEYSSYRTIRFDKTASWYNPEIHEDIIVVIWKIKKALAIHPSYEVPDTIETNITASEMKKRGVFEFGKRYLVAGHIKNLKMINEEGVTIYGKYIDTLNYFREYSFNSLPLDNDLNYMPDQESDGYFNSYVELKDDVDVFLNSVEGAKYKQLIENCQFFNQSSNVIATDNINAVLHFNQKKAHIVNGREITPEEYKRGQNVCVVSWKFAELNNLKVGDEIKLSLTNAKYEYSPRFGIEREPIWFLNADPYSTPNFKEQSFKIVGVYQAPNWEVSEFMLSPNTIFVPSKSVDLSTVEQDDTIVPVDKKTEMFSQFPTMLYSIIIPNDKLEEFKDDMNQRGINKYFLYYDQGYSSVKSVIEILTQNSIIILSVCFAVWLLVLILFILLYIVKEKKIAGIMVSLGVGVKRTFAHLLISCMLLTIPSTIFGGIISSALEDSVTKFSYDMAVNQIMDNSFNRTFSANSDSSYNVLNEKDNSDKENKNSLISLKFNGLTFIIESLQFIIIICISSVFIYVMLRKNPMELVKSKE